VRLSTTIERAALLLVPARDHDALLGDLNAENLRDKRARAWVIARVGFAFQREPYRDDRARAGILGLFLACLALLRIIPLAAGEMSFTNLDGVIWHTAAEAWSHSTVIGGIAAGLLLGRSRIIPDYAAAARWHIVLVLCVASAFTVPGLADGVLTLILLPASAALGTSARRDSTPPGAAA
jgi:hypothetical protein